MTESSGSISDAVLQCDMTNDKETLKSAVNGMRADGLTSVYQGIGKAMDVFETPGYDTDCSVLRTPALLKTPQIRSFFFEKWLLFGVLTLVSYYITLVECAGKAGVTIIKCT